MLVHIDLTNSPHVPFFRPLISELEARGHSVTITAREFAQTVAMARQSDLEFETIGRHGGGGSFGKAKAMSLRVPALRRHLKRQAAAHGRPYDVMLSHGSTDLPVVSRMLKVPHVTIFDYEWAATMHRMNCRYSWRVMTPDSIPAERLDPYHVAGKLVQYPGLKEDYYLPTYDFDAGIRLKLGIPQSAILAVLRPPPELALYHRGHANTIFEDVIKRLIADEDTCTVVLARTPEQRLALVGRWQNETERLLFPGGAIDGPSLVAEADLVISAGGTMNREAAALGVPVWTVFAGKMGGVDEALLASGKMHQLQDVSNIEITARPADAKRRVLNPKDPADLLDLALKELPVLDHV